MPADLTPEQLEALEAALAEIDFYHGVFIDVHYGNGTQKPYLYFDGDLTFDELRKIVAVIDKHCPDQPQQQVQQVVNAVVDSYTFDDQGITISHTTPRRPIPPRIPN